LVGDEFLYGGTILYYVPGPIILIVIVNMKNFRGGRIHCDEVWVAFKSEEYNAGTRYLAAGAIAKYSFVLIYFVSGEN